MSDTENSENIDDDVQVSAHPLKTNEELWDFAVKSQDMCWNRYIPIFQSRGEVRYLGAEYDSLQTPSPANVPNTKREIIVCHDMMGNYREDRKFGTSTKWDEYRFYHWSCITYFCYFSHYYITIPPATWITACHKHGVSTLGTIMTEREDGAKRLKQVLKTTETVNKTVDALVKLCEHFCFEGYLVNIECKVLPEQVPNLEYFVKSLTESIHQRIPNGIVLWYDSVCNDGRLDWQNELNESNYVFFQACDGILLNYNWTDKHLEKTRETLGSAGPEKVFVGVDVFGRGQSAGLESSLTVQKIPIDFSINIFAPGWTFENTATTARINPNTKVATAKLNELFLETNEKFWSLHWEYLPTFVYTKLPFYTDFCIGSGKHLFYLTYKSDRPFFDLSKQSLQPSIPLIGRADRCLDDGVDGGSCLKIVQVKKAFRLFSTQFLVEKTLVFGFASKGKISPPQLDCVLEIEGIATPGLCEIVCGNYPTFKAKKSLIFIPRIRSNSTYKVTRFLNDLNEHVRLPYALPNGWIVQYFIISFDQPVNVKDIGVFCRAEKENETIAEENFLGAIYLHAGNLSVEGISEVHIQDHLSN